LVIAAYIAEWLKNNRPEQISSRSIPTKVYVALDYALQIINVMPEPGRDRVSLLRL